MVVVEPTKGLTYYMDGKLEKQLIKIKKRVLTKDTDYVLVFDGEEGCGKSVDAMQVGKFLDPSLDLSRVCFNPTEFKEAILIAKKGQCVIYDEAYSGLASRTALSEVNHILVSLMTEMRQKNLFVFIVLPTFFLLDKYVALWRAKGLFHIYFKDGKRGRWVFFNKKKKKLLYLKGKKEYSYGGVRSSFRGRFVDKYVVNEQEYRKKKALALKRRDRTTRQEKYKEQRDKMLFVLYKEMGLSLRKLSDTLKQYGVSLNFKTLGVVMAKFKGRS